MKTCPQCGEPQTEDSDDGYINFACGSFSHATGKCLESTDTCRRIMQLQSSLATAERERERITDEWAVMARACGNWRTWPGEVESDHEHNDWKVASRAIIERDELRAKLAQLQSVVKAAVADALPYIPEHHARGTLLRMYDIVVDGKEPLPCPST